MPSILIERQSCVNFLYDNLPDKSKVLTSKKVTRIEHTETGVRVHLADGTVEEGDMVIGADGVHSIARTQMWDYASEYAPESIPESDKQALFSDYLGLFGVSKTVKDFGLSECHTVLGHGNTKIVFTQPGRVYWALMFRDEHNCPPKKVKLTEEEKEEIARKYWDSPITTQANFSDLWENRIRSGIVAVEEGVLDKWHTGRIVLVGDAAHKVSLIDKEYNYMLLRRPINGMLDDCRSGPGGEHRYRGGRKTRQYPPPRAETECKPTSKRPRAQRDVCGIPEEALSTCESIRWLLGQSDANTLILDIGGKVLVVLCVELLQRDDGHVVCKTRCERA